MPDVRAVDAIDAVERIACLDVARNLMLFCVVALAMTACPAPQRPNPGAPETIEVGRSGTSLRSVAADADVVYVAMAGASTAGTSNAVASSAVASNTGTSNAGASGAERSTIVAWRGSTIAWETPIAGRVGPIARTEQHVVATLAGTGSAADIALRGSPGAVVVALDPASGVLRWKLAIDASEWCIVTAIAAAGPDVLVGGAFSGSLRAASRVVSSGGRSDGFVARLTARGEVAWLVRVGGPGADGVYGVAAAGERIAIAGTFAAGADLLGTALAAFDEKSPLADGFVAELDANGAVRWAQSFGGKADDVVAGVAIDAAGRVVVAATARDTVRIAGNELVAQGAADGLVAWWEPGGTKGHAFLLGGPDFDGTQAIVAVGARVVVAGFFSGTLHAGARSFHATGDDAYAVALDGETVVDVWPIGGDGREEVAALAPRPNGFVAGVAHTNKLVVDGITLPPPQEPTSGAAIVARVVR